MAHGPVFPAAGYRFDYRGRSVVVSGDTAPSLTLAKYARGVDVLLHEGLQTAMVSVLHDAAVRNNLPTFAKITADIPSYHSTPEGAARIARMAGVRYLMFYHTIPPLPIRVPQRCVPRRCSEDFQWADHRRQERDASKPGSRQHGGDVTGTALRKLFAAPSGTVRILQ